MPVTATSAKAKDKARRSGVIARRVQAYAILVAWAILILIFTVLLPDVFFSTQNFTAIANSKTATVLLTLGLLFALSAGEFDLSIGAALSLGAAIPAWLFTAYGTPVLAGIAIAVIAAALMGTLNAVLAVRYEIPSLIVTLGTGTAVIGIVAGAVGNSTISIRGDWWNTALTQRTFGLYTSFWLVMLIALGIWYLLQHTPSATPKPASLSPRTAPTNRRCVACFVGHPMRLATSTSRTRPNLPPSKTTRLKRARLHGDHTVSGMSTTRHRQRKPCRP